MKGSSMRITKQLLKKAHRASFENEESIRKSKECLCFHCNNLFPPSEIQDWVNDAHGRTALCPYCRIDSVIGDEAGYPFTEKFILAMNGYWFGLQKPERRENTNILSSRLMRARLSRRRKKTRNNLQNTAENSVPEETKYLASGTVRF